MRAAVGAIVATVLLAVSTAPAHAQVQPVVTISARQNGLVSQVAFCDRPTVFEDPVPGLFRVVRSDASNPLDVDYTVAGTSVPGTDYEPLSGQVSFDSGATEAIITVMPLDSLHAGSVEITLTDGAEYDLGSPAATEIRIMAQGNTPSCPGPITPPAALPIATTPAFTG